MGVGETSLLVTFLAIPVLLDPADSQHRTSSSARVPAPREVRGSNPLSSWILSKSHE
jgi:hypothetical protein